jgi:hypothetical protein
MFRSHIIAILFITTFQAVGQSNVVAVSRSEMTGIELPAGSKQDKRILSTAAAETLMEMTAKDNGITLDSKSEVFSLTPPSKQTEELVKLAAQKAGWVMSPFSSEPAYTLLKNNDRTVLMYLQTFKKETILYLMPLIEVKSEAPAVVTQPVQVAVVQVQPEVEESPVISTSVVEAKPQQSTVAPSGNFTFNTINFDDGWTSTIESDFVRVAKGNINVLLYYSIEITDQMRNSSLEFSEYFWNLLVVPNYNVRSAQRFVEGVTYFRTYFIEGEAIDPKTGKLCYLALNVLVNSGVATPVLAIAPDKNSYVQQFPEPKSLGDMTGYNKFAVSAKDIVGTWSSNSGSAVNLYNTYSGNYAGMNSAQSSDSFTFNADGTYSSKHSGASSVYGTNTYYSQEYKGKLTVTNWDITMTNRFKDATNIYFAQFEVIRNGRILHLQDKAASGMRYHLVRSKE